MAKLPVKDLHGLMDLLDEQDDILYAKISEGILSYGLIAIPYLEAKSDSSLGDIVHSRIKKLISNIRIQNLYSELHNWATLDSSDLLKGYFLISKYQFPDLDEESVMAKVEALKTQVWLELKKGMTPFESAKVISKVFFEINKFSFNQNVDAQMDSICLNALLNSKKGHPQGFTILYAGIAQRLDLPFYGIKMTNSMFLAYVYSENSKCLNFKNDVKFYLNPFKEGAFFTNSQMEDHIKELHPKEVEKYTGACTNPVLLSQILLPMLLVSIAKNNNDKTADLIMLIKALDVS